LEAEVKNRSVSDEEAGLETVGLIGQGHQSEGSGPEVSKPLRVRGVEDEILQVHGQPA
jgi:hypothetical protein